MIEGLKRLGPFYVEWLRDEQSYDYIAGVQVWRHLCMEVSVSWDWCCHSVLKMEIAPWPWVALTLFHHRLHIGGVHHGRWAKLAAVR